MTDPTLLRYALRNTPRYTSYPTAPHFNNGVGTDRYADWLAGLDSQARGSLYLHIPYCQEMCWYCGCQTRATKREKPVRRYAQTLLKEIHMTAGAIPHRLKVDHIHWGGGTPTLTAPEDLSAIMQALREGFDIQPDAEIAIEADPRTLSEEMAQTLAANGFNRASLGVQSFDADVQRAINRVQDFATTKTCADRLREAGIARINLDLLYGLPGQSEQSCRETVWESLALNPDRLSVFGYAHVPHMRPHQKMIDETTLPGPEARIAQAEIIAEELTRLGYVAIGIDHYAREDDELARQQRDGRLHRNFQGYTTDAADALIGLGASSIGQLPQGYVQNAPSTAEWARRIEAGEFATVRGFALNEDDRLRADIIERLMCDLAVSEDEIRLRHGRGFPEHDLAEYRERDIIRKTGDRLEIDPEYRLLARNIAAAFDAYLPQSTAIHSRSI